MFRLPWFTFTKDAKGKVTNAEKFGHIAISDRFEDGKPRIILKDPDGNEFVLNAQTVKEGEGEDAKITILTVFEPMISR